MTRSYDFTPFLAALLLSLVLATLPGCNKTPPTSDVRQQAQQEKILDELTAKVGMPGIKNARERKLLRDIFELRDQKGLVTYTYLYNQMTGELVFFGETIGYGIPYSAQFSNPMKTVYRSRSGGGYSYMTLPQADPNGLFTPTSSSATWVMLKDPNSGDVQPVYVEPTIVVTPFRLPHAVYPK